MQKNPKLNHTAPLDSLSNQQNVSEKIQKEQKARGGVFGDGGLFGVKNPAFSMLELVFVIVILGILASIAIPKFSLTRGDAQSVSIQSDLNQAISAIQREVFMTNPSPSQITGAYMMEVSGLSKSRWIAVGNGIKLAKNGAVDSQNDCVILEFIDSKNLHAQIKDIDTPLCKKLYQTYEEKTIPLFAK